MADAIRNEASERAGDGGRSDQSFLVVIGSSLHQGPANANAGLEGSYCLPEEPENPQTHLITRIPQTKVVHDASAEESFEGPKHDSTDDQTCVIERDRLQYTDQAP